MHNQRLETISDPAANDQINGMDRVLEAAVIVNWADLMPGTRPGLIHIECDCAPDGGIKDLQLWSSVTKGYWLLACTYSMIDTPLHGSGVHFDNGYKSERLAQILEMVMQHQSAFDLLRGFGGQRLLQVENPTAEETKAATTAMDGFFDRCRN
jgi:hypothetical protein